LLFLGFAVNATQLLKKCVILTGSGEHQIPGAEVSPVDHPARWRCNVVPLDAWERPQGLCMNTLKIPVPPLVETE